MKFQFRFFVKNFDEIFFFEFGQVVWGVCHFDTGPREKNGVSCQNDIPPTPPGQQKI